MTDTSSATGTTGNRTPATDSPPRIVNRLLRRVRDFAQVEGEGRIDIDTARRALELLEVDELGFDEVDRKILTTLIEHYGGGPAGIKAIAAAARERKPPPGPGRNRTIK